MWFSKLRIRKMQSFIIFLISLIVTLLISSAFGILITLDKPMDSLVKECNSPILKDPFSLNSAFSMDIVVKNIPKELDIQKTILVYGKKGAKGQEIVDEYRKDNDGLLNGYVILLDDCVANSTIAENITGGILLGIGVLILLVSIIMFRFMIKNAMINDKKTIAIYKSIGYSSNEVLMMTMKFYLFLVSIGSIIGAFLSEILVDSFLSQQYKNMGESHSYGNFLPAALSTVLIVSFILMSIYLICRKIKNVTPVSVLREEDKNRSAKKSIVNVWGFSSFKMAIRNIFRDKLDTLFVILICFFSIYIVNFGMQSLLKVYNMKDDNYYWFGFDKCDLTLDASSDSDYEDMYNTLNKDDNTKKLLKSSVKNVNLLWKKGMSNTSTDVQLYDNFKDADINILEGHNPKNIDEIAISSKVSEETNKKIGDYITVYMNKDKKVSLLITGVYQTYFELGWQVRMLSSTYSKYNPNEVVHDEISIYLKDTSKLNEYKKKYNKEFKNKGQVIVRKNKFSNIMSKICDPQKKAIAPFISMTLILGGINIFGIIVLKNAKNRKSYCIYKSIGYSSFDLVKTNIIYISIIAVVSMGVTLPVFFLTYEKLMSLCLITFGIREYPMDFVLKDFVLCNSAVLILFLLFTLLSSRAIYKYKVSELNSLFTYMMNILMSLMMVSFVFVMVIMSRSSAERIVEVLSEESTITNCNDPILEVEDGSIEFDDVNFSYSNEEDNLNLDNNNLKINSGETIGILGGTGSAKTTFVQLIPRLYDVTSGSIKVGGIDVRNYDIETLRNEVSMVLQKNVLFSGTIKENLRWGNKNATDEEIIKAAQSACCEEFVSKFPDKYDTFIEQGGSNVSGGQKQRLCIARALLKKPKILILDDSTSAVDTKTDALIRRAFKEDIPNTTKIIIAQRISSIQDCDRIIVLDDGKINAFSTHDDLVKNNPIYREVYEQQVKGDDKNGK